MESQTQEARPTRRPRRVLKKEAVLAVAVRRQRSAVAELYERPVEELSPEDIRRMRAAFLFG